MFGFIKNSTKMYFNEQSRMQSKTRNCSCNIDEPVFYPFSTKTSKYSGSWNNINDPYTKMCVPDVIKI